MLFTLFGFGYSYEVAFLGGAIGATIYFVMALFLFAGKKYTFFSLLCNYNSMGAFLFNAFLLLGFVIYFFSCWNIVGSCFHVFVFYPVLFILSPDRWCLSAKGATFELRRKFAPYFFVLGVVVFALIHCFVPVVPCMQVVVALFSMVIFRHIFTRMAE
jgi:hypothetical protein